MNSIQQEGGYNKQAALKKAMTKILAQNPNGIESEKFITEVRKATGVSRGTIYKKIKEFTNVLELMRIERKREDNREVTYFPNVEKVNTEQAFSESVEFIRGLGPNVRFGEAKQKKSEFMCNFSVFSNIEKTAKGQLEQQAEKFAKLFLDYAAQIVESYAGVSSSFKIAYIATLERQDVKP